MAGSGQVGKERRIITWFLTFTFVKAQEGSRTGEGEGGVGRDRLTRNLALPRARCNSRQKKKIKLDQMSLYGSIFSVDKDCNL